ncbi:MAG: PAS domain S-box protein, partial [Pseudomonadales bacterium]|nr:PAS domain S-box protein [Pseudomonadales bacterium]
MTRPLRLNPSATADVLNTMDWATSPLGPVDEWPLSLRSTVEMCLNSRFPMAIGWGPDLINFYNDGYLPILGNKHPEAFGAQSKGVYEELWDWFLEPRVRQVLDEGRIVWETDFQIPLIKHGKLQEAYFTFCYSPVADDDGEWQGVLSVASETTKPVIDARRDDMIHFVVRKLSGNRSLQAIPEVLLEALERNPVDCRDYALVQYRNEGEISEVIFASSREFSSRVVEQVNLSESPVLRIDEHLYAINSIGHEIESEFSYSLVIGPDELVFENDALRIFLERIRSALLVSIERLRADERALSERDRLYRMLFENTLDGIFLTAPDGSILAANPAACKLLDYTEDELRNLGRRGVIFSDDQEVLSALQTRQETGQFSGELKFRKRDDSVLRSDLSSVRFFDDSGRERNLIIFRDASDRLEAEERNQRSARLEAVGQLTGGIAHDFNNLLQVMLGGADELLHLLPEGSDARKYADMVFSASQRAADLTRQLLAFSRQQALAPQIVDISSQIREMDQILDRAIGEQIQVQIELGEDVRAFLDPAQLQSAILNLAINAKDAMPEGGRLTLGSEAISVGAELSEEIECSPGEYVRIHVE